MRASRLLTLCVLAAFGCSGNDEGGSSPDARPAADAPLSVVDAGGETIDAAPGTTADAAPRVNDAGQPLCESSGGLVVCECSDGINNDSDPYIDSADPECTGPYDNDESSYATGIPGDNRDQYVQDCFFDGDSGGGNDGCRWDIRCTDPPNGSHCNNIQLEGCEKCKPLVPNGCDCFGCCDIYVDGVPHTVRIVDTCTADVIDDPVKCPTCTKVTDCENTCEACEECLGRPAPPDCTLDGGVGGQCAPDVMPCAEPDNTCPPEYRCITGCCVKYLSKQ